MPPLAPPSADRNRPQPLEPFLGDPSSNPIPSFWSLLLNSLLRDIFGKTRGGTSKGHCDTAFGILKTTMRDQEHGVDEYYKKVGATYRNPHFPGIKGCLNLWLNRWWRMRQPHIEGKRFMVFDMACGSGEVTVTVMEWWQDGRAEFNAQQGKRKEGGSEEEEENAKHPVSGPLTRRPPPIGPNMPVPCILAADPYTDQAFHTRTHLYAYPLSFRDIAEGRLPGIASKPIGAPKSSSSSNTTSPSSSLHGHSSPHSHSMRSIASSSEAPEDPIVEMVICSFALHLIEKPSELSALLWELSTKARWLVIIAPHDRPEIKDGWGWCKWDVETWSECRMADSFGELLEERVHCRVYHSLNV